MKLTLYRFCDDISAAQPADSLPSTALDTLVTLVSILLFSRAVHFRRMLISQKLSAGNATLLVMLLYTLYGITNRPSSASLPPSLHHTGL